MIASIRLQNFRSYSDSSFEFEPGVNIIVGPNASGKTNLLEAILVLCRGSSYRGQDVDVIAEGNPWARLDGFFTEPDQQRICKLTREGSRAQKVISIDDQSFSRLSVARSLPVVLFEPNHLQLITTSPEQRRSFLDDLLEQTNPLFVKTKRDYVRTLAQRNALLKRADATISTQMFAWNIRLSELAGELVRHRQALIATFNDSITGTYNAIAQDNHTVELAYASKLDTTNYASALHKKLEQDLSLDLARGFTGSGPHRDDLQISIDNTTIQQSASRGETRTVLLALKMKEAEILQEIREQKPLLLLDDVFGELDGKRRHTLTDFLQSYQTFITTTDADIATAAFMKKAHVIPL